MQYCLPVVLLGLLAAGCTSPPTQPTRSCTFSLSATAVTIGAPGGTASVTVATQDGCAWTASSQANWIAITGGAGATGSGAVAIIVQANPDGLPRSGILTLASQAVTITQPGQPCAYAVTPAGRNFGAAGGSGSFDVATPPGCTWSATSRVEWLTITAGGAQEGLSSAARAGDGTVTYDVAANPDAGPRTTEVDIGGTPHLVQQSAAASCAVTIAPDDEAFGPGGGNGTFALSAAESCAWAIQSSVGWIRVVSPAGGVGSGSHSVSYVVDAHTGLDPRSGTITVGGQTFVVSQAGNQACTYQVSPTSFSECLKGRERAFSVETQPGCVWSATSAATWLTVLSGQHGAGSGSVSFAFTYNFMATRDTKVEVRWPAPTLGQNVRVVQTGCLYAVAPEVFDVAAGGADVSFEAFASPVDPACGGPLQDACMWSAESSSPWVAVLTSMPRFGDNRVSVRIAPNTTGAARTAQITAGSRTVVIRQAG